MKGYLIGIGLFCNGCNKWRDSVQVSKANGLDLFVITRISMNKRTAKIHAMRCIAGLIRGMDAEKFSISITDIDSEDLYKVHEARIEIINELSVRAEEMDRVL